MLWIKNSGFEKTATLNGRVIKAGHGNVFQFYLGPQISFQTYLSKVNATIFQVEDTKSPQSRNLEFHNLHSTDLRIPVLRRKYWSLTVKVDKSKMIKTAKSSRL